MTEAGPAEDRERAPEGRLGRPLRGLSLLSVVSLFVLMFLITVDAMGRYFFASPIRGSLEISDMLMCAIIFAGLPFVCLRGGHITIDLLDNVIPPLVARVRDVVVSVVTAGFFALVAWRMTEYALKLMDYGDHSLLLGIPLYPASLFIALAAAISTLVLLVHAAGQALGRRRQPPGSCA